MSKCPYCESDTNDFQPVNQSVEYSGIEVSLNRQGMLRVRTYPEVGDTFVFGSEDIVELKYCPLCGKRFSK